LPPPSATSGGWATSPTECPTRYLERGLRLSEPGQISTFLILTAASLGYAYALSGCVTEALPLLAQALEEADRSGFMLNHALYVAWLSEASLLADRKEDALALAQRALERSRAHKERGHQAHALRLLGEMTFWLPQAEAALVQVSGAGVAGQA
jgi:tetratricopeptide (TPR) repeat protein